MAGLDTDNRALIPRPNPSRQLLNPDVWGVHLKQLIEGQNRAIREAPVPLSAEEIKIKSHFFNFNELHSGIVYTSHEKFVEALFDTHEEEFLLLEGNIKLGIWNDSDQVLLDRGLARDIGRWRDETGTGFYRVWAVNLDEKTINGANKQGWRIYYQPTSDLDGKARPEQLP